MNVYYQYISHININSLKYFSLTAEPEPQQPGPSRSTPTETLDRRVATVGDFVAVAVYSTKGKKEIFNA